MKIPVYNLKGEEKGKEDLPENVFGINLNPEIVKQVIVAIAANQRQPWAHSKGRSDVRGGGRKPWRQKGTGRARHGSIRSPLWIGGGVTFGPLKERNYKKSEAFGNKDDAFKQSQGRAVYFGGRVKIARNQDQKISRGFKFFAG